MHSLPLPTYSIFTFVVALHYYTVPFLRPFSSRCPPVSSSSMTTGPILLTIGTLARQETFTWSSSLIHAIVGFTFIRHFNTHQRISDFLINPFSNNWKPDSFTESSMNTAKVYQPPHFKIIPPLLRSPPPHFLKSPIPLPYWQLNLPKFSLLTEMNCEMKFNKYYPCKATT